VILLPLWDTAVKNIGRTTVSDQVLRELRSSIQAYQVSDRDLRVAVNRLWHLHSTTVPEIESRQQHSIQISPWQCLLDRRLGWSFTRYNEGINHSWFEWDRTQVHAGIFVDQWNWSKFHRRSPKNSLIILNPRVWDCCVKLHSGRKDIECDDLSLPVD
jgi:hypothetical protein